MRHVHGTSRHGEAGFFGLKWQPCTLEASVNLTDRSHYTAHTVIAMTSGMAAHAYGQMNRHTYTLAPWLCLSIGNGKYFALA